MFETPIICDILRLISIGYLKLFGWKVEGKIPEHPRYVVIAAPHTSNWDMPIALFLARGRKLLVPGGARLCFDHRGISRPIQTKASGTYRILPNDENKG
jgi:hypothetical protein